MTQPKRLVSPERHDYHHIAAIYYGKKVHLSPAGGRKVAAAPTQARDELEPGTVDQDVACRPSYQAPS